MQIVASNPLAIDESSLDKDILNQKKIFINKSWINLIKKKILKEISEGKMKKFITENTLLINRL